MAESTSDAFRSDIFISAISRTCADVIDPTFSLFGSPDPLLMPAASKISDGAGGVLVINVNVLSAYTVISTGIILPICSCVLALNALQNSIMFTPCCPNAGPTGGAGLAFPAGI